MRTLRLEIELGPHAGDDAAIAARVAYQLREALGLTVAVNVVPGGTLPRFEMKASRFIVET
jgi:phenylacetate-CoA ligase